MGARTSRALSRRGRRARPRLSESTASEALRHWGGSCLICGAGARHWHHILDQQHYPELADEKENVIPLCEGCHRAHHARSKPIPRRYCYRAERYIPRLVELGYRASQVERYLERLYPGEAL